MAAGERPSPDALSTQVWIDAGTGYVADEPAGFGPTVLLDADVSDDPEETVLAVRDWTGLAELVTGTLASIGEELVRIDGISAEAITIGRGCLDTVPMAHAAGTPVICWQSAAQLSRGTFVHGETVSVKLLTRTGQGTLPLAQAPADAVTFASRAIRPLPPGRLQGNGAFVPDPGALVTGDLALSWAHRDRKSQTSAVIDSHTAGSIGPEPGVTCEVEIRWIDPATDAPVLPAAVVLDAGSTASFVLTAGHVPVAAAPAGTAAIAVTVWARRDGYRSRDARALRVRLPDTGGWGASWGTYWGG